MSVSLSESHLFGNLIGDRELVPLFSDDAQIRAMIDVEITLADAQSLLGIFPSVHYRKIREVLKDAKISGSELASGTESAGVPVPALVSKLRELVGEKSGRYVHYGATSQDIVDTGLSLRLKSVCKIIGERLDTLIEGLAANAEKFQNVVVPARTRSQQATPTVLGLKIASWIPPLVRSRQRLEDIQRRLLVVQFGGASGTLASLQGKGIEVMERLAMQLGLYSPVMPWHSQRDRIAEFSAFMTLISTSLGKLGQDLILLGQTEIRELYSGKSGGSSTMPQKANPVLAESLVAASRQVLGLNSTIQGAVIHSQERDGAAWMTEWLALPQLVVLTGAALLTAAKLVETLESDQEMIDASLKSSQGLIMAEAAAFALAGRMPLPKAQKIVKEACIAVSESRENLIDYLERTVEVQLDWELLRDPSAYLGNAKELISRVLESISMEG